MRSSGATQTTVEQLVQYLLSKNNTNKIVKHVTLWCLLYISTYVHIKYILFYLVVEIVPVQRKTLLFIWSIYAIICLSVKYFYVRRVSETYYTYFPR